MAKINLTADELTTLSNHMLKWREDIRSLNSKLCNQVRTMDGWRDPQFIMFLNAIENASQQLECYTKNLEQMGRSLKIYANQQRTMNTQLRSQIRSV